MKIKNSTLIFFWTALLLIGCTTEKPVKDIRVIDLENNVGKSRKVVLSEVAENIEYIPLETSMESFLGTPIREKLIYENGKLFIYQRGDYFKIFNSKGEYSGKFNKRGNGPKEYIGLYFVAIDSSAKVISIGTPKNIVEYKITGEYLRTIKLPFEEKLKGVNYTKLGIAGDKYYVLTTGIITPNDNHDYSAIIIDSTSKVVHKIPYPKKAGEFVDKLVLKKFPSVPFGSPITPTLFTFRDTVRIINETDQTIISVDRNLNIDTAYRLNYGKYCITNFPDLYTIRVEDQPYMQIYSRFFESSAFLFMSFRTGKLPFKRWEFTNVDGMIISAPVTRSFFNKKTGQFSFIDQCGVDEFGLIEDFEGGPAFWPLYISQDDYMVSYIDALKFIQYAQTHKVSDKFKKIADNLKEDDNPVVVLVKLKK